MKPAASSFAKLRGCDMEEMTLPWVQPLENLIPTLYQCVVEVNPCVFDGDCVQQTYDPAEADFWSVYLRDLDGCLECIADFETEAEARAYSERVLAWLIG